MGAGQGVQRGASCARLVVVLVSSGSSWPPQQQQQQLHVGFVLSLHTPHPLLLPCSLTPGQDAPEGKFFGNFPYPYMNGMLHLGHAFSLSKVCGGVVRLDAQAVYEWAGIAAALL